ncbi:MAG: hypothetical protein HGN29_17535 [Asgard group archaeon]|nr:hypothetical protein [Asgard group archaeon]
MTESSEISIEIEDKALLSQLETKTVFDLKLEYNNKNLIRNGFLLVILAMLFGGGLGAIIDLIYLYTGITNQYSILGIGSGAGAIFGLILGGFLLIALKSRMVEDIGAGHGLGVGTNIFVGAIIGTFFGAVIGSLFGLILKALDYFTDISISYPVFGMLIWITLGLNIGALIGLLASYGLMNIIFGGIIAGIVVGSIGMLAVFGFDKLVGIGTAAGIISGGLIGLLVRFSIDQSVVRGPRSGCGRLRPREESALATQSRSSDFCSGSDCGSCNTSSSCDCYGCGDFGDCGGGGGEACAFIAIFAAIIIPVIIIIAVLSWVSTKASVRLGGVAKRGAFTALGASFSIFLIIGSNIGLTEAHHNMLFEHNVLIGAGIGMIYGLLVFAALRLSAKASNLRITPYKITWKDRHTKGTVEFANIESIEFVREQRSTGTPIKSYEDYFIMMTKDGRSSKVVINCWKTPEGTPTTDYIELILSHYFGAVEKQRIQLREQYETSIPEEKPMVAFSGYSFTEQEEITDEMITKVEALIDAPRDVTVNWICSVTQYPNYIVEQIITEKLGFVIQDGKIIK